MTRPRIGLVGPSSAPFIELLSHVLERRGVWVRTLDLSLFPDKLSLTISEESLCADCIRLDRLDAIYVMRAEYMSPIVDWVSNEQRQALEARGPEQALRHLQESRSVRVSSYRLLSERCPVVNPAVAHRACLLLPVLLRRLEDARLRVMPFVAGNDLERIAYFVHEHGECRGRRLGQHSSRETVVDFDYLRDHHLDFDCFPLIVRRSSGGTEHHVLVVGGQPVGAAQYRNPEGWSPCAKVDGQARELAVAAAAVAGLDVALVHLEQTPDGQAAIVAVDPEPDLARLEQQAGLAAADALADRLIALARSNAQRTNPEQKRTTATRPRAGAGRRIGLVGRETDPETAAVARALTERGAEAHMLELFMFPRERSLHECQQGGRIATTDLDSLDAVYVRAVGGVSSPTLLGSEPHPGRADHQDSRTERPLRDEEACWRFCYGVLEALGRRIAVINPPLAQEVHRTKTHQLFSLLRAGFPVPPTLVSNDFDECSSFIAEAGGEEQVVAKPLAGIYKTVLLSERGLRAWLEQGPVMLQRFVRGDTLRAYFVRGRFIGAGRIRNSGRSVDSSVEQQGVDAIALPDDVVRMGWAAAEHLGLTWTGMDFIREAGTGRHLILECNASPMFVGFSRQTGHDVPGALAQALIDLAQDG